MIGSLCVEECGPCLAPRAPYTRISTLASFVSHPPSSVRVLMVLMIFDSIPHSFPPVYLKRYKTMFMWSSLIGMPLVISFISKQKPFVSFELPVNFFFHSIKGTCLYFSLSCVFSDETNYADIQIPVKTKLLKALSIHQMEQCIVVYVLCVYMYVYFHSSLLLLS